MSPLPHKDAFDRLEAWLGEARGRSVRLRRSPDGRWWCTLRHPTTAGAADVTRDGTSLVGAVVLALTAELD